MESYWHDVIYTAQQRLSQKKGGDWKTIVIGVELHQCLVVFISLTMCIDIKDLHYKRILLWILIWKIKTCEERKNSSPVKYLKCMFRVNARFCTFSLSPNHELIDLVSLNVPSKQLAGWAVGLRVYRNVRKGTHSFTEPVLKIKERVLELNPDDLQLKPKHWAHTRRCKI